MKSSQVTEFKNETQILDKRYIRYPSQDWEEDMYGFGGEVVGHITYDPVNFCQRIVINATYDDKFEVYFHHPKDLDKFERLLKELNYKFECESNDTSMFFSKSLTSVEIANIFTKIKKDNLIEMTLYSDICSSIHDSFKQLTKAKVSRSELLAEHDKEKQTRLAEKKREVMRAQEEKINKERMEASLAAANKIRELRSLKILGVFQELFNRPDKPSVINILSPDEMKELNGLALHEMHSKFERILEFPNHLPVSWEMILKDLEKFRIIIKDVLKTEKLLENFNYYDTQLRSLSGKSKQSHTDTQSPTPMDLS